MRPNAAGRPFTWRTLFACCSRFVILARSWGSTWARFGLCHRPCWGEHAVKESQGPLAEHFTLFYV